MAKPTPIDYTSATFDNTAGTILVKADAGMPNTTPGGALSFFGVLDTANVRARSDGTAPTTSEGQLIFVGDQIFLSVEEFSRTQFIRTTSTSGVLKGHFYGVDVTTLMGGN